MEKELSLKLAPPALALADTSFTCPLSDLWETVKLSPSSLLASDMETLTAFLGSISFPLASLNVMSTPTASFTFAEAVFSAMLFAVFAETAVTTIVLPAGSAPSGALTFTDTPLDAVPLND